MAGKRIGTRAHHGPEEDRARKPAEDRKSKGRLRMNETDQETQGMTAKDAARFKSWTGR